MTETPNDVGATETDAAAVRAAAEEAVRRPPGLPDKFWDGEAESVRTEALAKSYVELERKLGGGAGGVPETAEGYDIVAPNDLVTPEPGINARLHAAGFAREQAQLVYDLAAEHLLPAVSDLAAEFEAQAQIDRLVGHFGGEQRWRETARQIAAWGRAHLPDEVFDSLSTTCEGVLALHRMMTEGEPAIARGTGAAGAIPTEGDLRDLMRDPRYWRDQDPATVARVREGYRQLYPGEG